MCRYVLRCAWQALLLKGRREELIWEETSSVTLAGYGILGWKCFLKPQNFEYIMLSSNFHIVENSNAIQIPDLSIYLFLFPKAFKIFSSFYTSIFCNCHDYVHLWVLFNLLC